MKNQNRISPLTLELYHRGLATRKEKKQVEKALKTDSDVRNRYEALKESDRVINQLITKELARLNMPEAPAVPVSHRKKAAWVIAAAAILLCALVPAILYLKSGGSNKDNVIAEESAKETIPDIYPPDVTELAEDIPIEDKAPTPEQPVRKERGSSGEKTVIAETPRPESGPAVEPEFRPESSGTEIAAIPAPDTGVRLRGGGQINDQGGTGTVPEEPPNINIPPGLTLIFDNMFANRGLTFVIIPARITSIGKNAFAGNPLVSVTIGANVAVDDEAFPGNFAGIYNAGGRAAGTFTRPDVMSEAWEKK